MVDSNRIVQLLKFKKAGACASANVAKTTEPIAMVQAYDEAGS